MSPVIYEFYYFYIERSKLDKVVKILEIIIR
jgi:hypothetical protein